MQRNLKTRSILLFVIIATVFFFIKLAPISLAIEVDLDLTTPTTLNGTWYYYPDLLPPGDLKHKLEANQLDSVTLPGSFQKHLGTKQGFASYVTQIRIPQTYVGQKLAIYIPWQPSAHRLFINEIEIAKSGVVGKDGHSHKSELGPVIAFFEVEDPELFLTLQISSFKQIRGGPENPLYLGTQTAILQQAQRKVFYDLFLIGGIFSMGLFMLVLTTGAQKDRTHTWIGLFCLFVSLRTLFLPPFYYSFVFPSLAWIISQRLEYIFTILSSGTFLFLIFTCYGQHLPQAPFNFLFTLHGFLLILAVLGKPLVFQTWFFRLFVLVIPLCIYLLYIMFKGRKTKESIPYLNQFGIIIVLVAASNDFLFSLGYKKGPELILPATAFYVFLHLFIMGRQFNLQGQEQIRLNQKLLDANRQADRTVRERTMLLEVANRRLEELAEQDGLTGIFNRHRFNQEITGIYTRSQTLGFESALLMIDVDKFKPYNDYYGHVQGDELLKELVQLIKTVLPEGAIFARYGGEEFAILLEDTRHILAHRLAEKIRTTVEQEKLEHLAVPSKIVTVSIGVTTLRTPTNFHSISDWIAAADKKLYQAKAEGRNKVV